MSKLFSVLAAAFLSLGLAAPSADACEGHKGKDAPAAKAQPAQKPATASFKVDGMHCGGCGDKVKAALIKQDGVTKVDVKVADKRVVVDFDAAKISAEKIAKIISDLGYKAAAEA